jgi:YbbR domain-containing protein
MKFFNGGRIAFNLLSLVVAILTALCIWYVVSVRERRETQMDIVLDYHGIPTGLVVTEGLAHKVAVRLRGSETLLNTFSQQRLVRSVDLSHIRKGVTTVPLTTEILGQDVVQTFDVMDIQPTRIVVKADRLVERSVPLRYALDSPLRGDALTVGDVEIIPSTVVLRGPEKVISGISSLSVNMPLDPTTAGTRIRTNVVLDTPDLVTALPSSVQVQYTITSGRMTLTRQCKINLVTENNKLYDMTPTEIPILVEVPEAMSKNSRYLSQLEVVAVPPALAPGQKGKALLRFRLPDGMTVVNNSQEDVIITRKANPTD